MFYNIVSYRDLLLFALVVFGAMNWSLSSRQISSFGYLELTDSWEPICYCQTSYFGKYVRLTVVSLFTGLIVGLFVRVEDHT